MPTPCSLFIKEYPGESEKVGRQDSLDVFEIEHHIHQPVDLTTGQATGVRVHAPLRVVVEFDKAAPGLHKALCTGQNLESVRLEFWHIAKDTRAEEKYFEITLSQARVVDARPYMPMSFLPANEPYRHMLQLSFVYEKILWVHEKSKYKETDEWRKPS